MAEGVEPEVLIHVGRVLSDPPSRCEGARVLGPLIIQNFLDAPSCRQIRLAMDAGVPEPAEILGDTFAADDEVRRATHIEIDDDTMALLEGRLDDAIESIAQFFKIGLTGREGASILRYASGGFFRAHKDRAHTTVWPGAAKRRIAVVVFLTTSRQSDSLGSFSGGTLRLFPDEALTPSVDVHPRARTLVAFPATILHEVTTVRHGTRDAIVDWYY